MPPLNFSRSNSSQESSQEVLYAMATAPKKFSQIDKAITQRLKDYWGAFLRQVRYLDIEKDIKLILSRADAPVYYTLNNHAF